MVQKEKTADEMIFGKWLKTLRIFFITVFSIFTFTILFLFALQRYIRLGKYKKIINEELVKILAENNDNIDNQKFKINGKILFKSFPRPHIIIDDIEGKNLKEKNFLFNFDIKKIKLILSTKSLIFKDIIIKK